MTHLADGLAGAVLIECLAQCGNVQVVRRGRHLNFHHARDNLGLVVS